MIKNYFKIAWRNILKNKSLFIINILGLGIGIASCLLILLFVTDELSYDNFHDKSKDIYRVVFKAKINGELIKEAVVMPPVAQTLVNDFPEVKEATRFRKITNPKVTFNNHSYRDGKFAYVDPNFFNVFSFPIIKGNKTNPLSEPNTIVLTEEEAYKYFGDSDPIGRTLNIDDLQFRVTAIIAKIPDNSHFHFDLFASMLGHQDAKSTSWMKSDFYSYLVLKKGTNPKNLEAKLPAVIEQYMGPQMKAEIGMSYTDFTKDGEIGLFLQPLTEIHLNSDFSSASTLEQGGDYKSVYIFSIVALFMLLLACVNFMNLATASATKRAKEVGIRKVLGSKKKQLVYQFLTESFIATAISMFLAITLVIVFLPLFNELSDKSLSIRHLLNLKTISALFFLMLLISFLAGVYPAFYISSFKPITALKSKFASPEKNKGVRSSLVVFQFVISAGLILATIIVEQQMDFIQNKNIGYNKEQLLVLRDAYFLGNNQEAFKNQLLNDPSVARVTKTSFAPAGITDHNSTGIYVNQKFERKVNIYNIDEQYIPTMGMELIAGRNFSKDFGTDSLSVIVNETTVKKLGFGKQALGKPITVDENGVKKTLTITGVVKDFHYRSLHQKIDPLIMLNKPYGGFIVKTKTADMSKLISRIATIWNDYNVEEPFSYSVLDDAYNSTYLREQRMGIILSIFAILTIFIACLGLFALVTFSTEQKVKEIGIRKVLGSSVVQIVGMLTKEFIKLVVISFLIAFPIGFYLMHKWLQDFAYRIEIHWSVFLFAGFITTTIAFLTISLRSIKAANANPIQSLKTE